MPDSGRRASTVAEGGGLTCCTVRPDRILSRYDSPLKLRSGGAVKLQQLDALRAVPEAGSLHEATRRLFLTQPAISRSIKDLKVELSMQLLTRSASSATLVPFAHRVIKRALIVQREVGRNEAIYIG